jgi:plasmid stability protein
VPDILLKGVPDSVHRKLKSVAARHRRSMNHEAIVLIEEALRQTDASADLPSPLQGRFPLTPEFVERAKRVGRE